MKLNSYLKPFKHYYKYNSFLNNCNLSDDIILKFILGK